MKKLAIVSSGWHYGSGFYEKIPTQELPKGWSMDLFCISHRDPVHAKEEKKDKVFTGERGYLDQRLYKEVLSKEQVESLGWKYIEKPNTIGDWGNSNQWLENYNYKDYDLLLFTHDDNLILLNTWFKDIIKDKAYKDWEILCNSAGMPKGWVRGSCEFFKPSLLDKLGGKFDLSETTLTREGQTSASENLEELYNWNTTVDPLMKFVQKNNIQVGYMSPAYRVSAYCIEGERGYISNTHGANTAEEDIGLNFLKTHGLI